MSDLVTNNIGTAPAYTRTTLAFYSGDSSMTCDAIGTAIRKCPFLHQVSTEQGEEYARKIATRPALPAATARHGPVFEERSCDFAATLKLFHGPSGVVPLKRVTASLAEVEQASQSAQHSSGIGRSGALRNQWPQSCNAPFASMNMAGAFNFLVSIHSYRPTYSLPAHSINKLAHT